MFLKYKFFCKICAYLAKNATVLTRVSMLFTVFTISLYFQNMPWAYIMGKAFLGGLIHGGAYIWGKRAGYTRKENRIKT